MILFQVTEHRPSMYKSEVYNVRHLHCVTFCYVLTVVAFIVLPSSITDCSVMQKTLGEKIYVVFLLRKR